MVKSTLKTRRLVQVALLSAIIAIMATVPYLGYIPLGAINATTIHIPVIIGAVLLGPKYGGFLGGVFGLTSLINNTFKPNLVSFVFTPFYSFSPEFHGSFSSLLICFVPRILIGVIAGYLFYMLRKTKLPASIGLAVTGFIGSMVNTVLVMGGIYVFFGASYAAAKNIAFEALFGVIMGIVGVSGVVEAIVAAVITMVITIPLQKYAKI